MRNKLQTCYVVLLGLVIALTGLKFCEILFFVDKEKLLLNMTGTSTAMYVVFVLLTVAAAVSLLFVLKSKDFKAFEYTYTSNYNLAVTFLIIVSAVSLVYSVISGTGYMNTSVGLTVISSLMSVLMIGFYVVQTVLKEKLYKHSYSLVIMVIPIIYMLYRLIVTFLYYTNNTRNFNYQMEILIIMSFVLFFLYFGKLMSGKGSVKAVFVTGLLSFALMMSSAVPMLLTVSMPEVYKGNTAAFLFQSVTDIMTVVYILITVCKQCRAAEKNKN